MMNAILAKIKTKIDAEKKKLRVIDPRTMKAN
jgi:hypothetical protein